MSHSTINQNCPEKVSLSLINMHKEQLQDIRHNKDIKCNAKTNQNGSRQSTLWVTVPYCYPLTSYILQCCPFRDVLRETLLLLDDSDLELTNESVHCWGKNSSYITMLTSMSIYHIRSTGQENAQNMSG